jgi:hypothetical protein
MRTQPTSRILANHPPQEYYEAWAKVHGIDITKVPFLKQDLAMPESKLVPFAVFDFDIKRDDFGHQVAMAEVWYKALFSKHSFRVIVYL